MIFHHYGEDLNCTRNKQIFFTRRSRTIFCTRSEEISVADVAGVILHENRAVLIRITIEQIKFARGSSRFDMHKNEAGIFCPISVKISVAN